MEENRADIITDKVKKIMSAVQSKIEEQYKHTKKFRQEPMSPQEQVVIYKSLTEKDIVEGLENTTQFYQQRIQQILSQHPQEEQAGVLSRMYTPEEMAIEDMNDLIFEQETLLRRYKK